MASADTVYYQDDNVRITGEELTLDGQPYRMAFVTSVRIETLPLYTQTANPPLWLDRLMSIGVLVALPMWLVYSVAHLANIRAILDFMQVIGWPILLLIAAAWIGREILDLVHRQQAPEIPLLRFRRPGWYGVDLRLASLDRAYLRGLVAVMRQVLRREVATPVAIAPPVATVNDHDIHINDQIYPLSAIESVDYLVARHKYADWLSLLSSVGLALWVVARMMPDQPAGINLPTILTSVAVFIWLLLLIVNERRPPVYILALVGSFGTVYPYASTSRSRVSSLVSQIKQQLAGIRPNQKPPLLQGAST